MQDFEIRLIQIENSNILSNIQKPIIAFTTDHYNLNKANIERTSNPAVNK